MTVIGLGCLAAAIGQGSFLHSLALMGVGLYLVAPLLCLIGIVALLDFFRRVHRSWLLPSFFGALLLILALVLSFGVGQTLYSWQRARVHSFVDRAHVELDNLKKTSGAYPVALPSSLLAAAPTWLSSPGCYWSDGSTFSFSYSDPASMMFGGFTYSSVDRKWIYDD
jgi:hypothetical protein